ncbi:MAG: hypothetical protein QOG64_2808, partial [Acidimicrobiaceae bacterium]|nr:hypothetical protein [Acidimicrobiaceae bacterium]
ARFSLFDHVGPRLLEYGGDAPTRHGAVSAEGACRRRPRGSPCRRIRPIRAAPILSIGQWANRRAGRRRGRRSSAIDWRVEVVRGGPQLCAGPIREVVGGAVCGGAASAPRGCTSGRRRHDPVAACRRPRRGREAGCQSDSIGWSRPTRSSPCRSRRPRDRRGREGERREVRG